MSEPSNETRSRLSWVRDMNPEQRLNFEKCRREYHIQFLHDTGENIWPASHRRVFKAIQDLGQTKYEEYAAQGDLSYTDEPWKVRRKLLTKSLTENYQRCIRRNEASWRFACENIVFSRFNTEVACTNCRKRIWRSELEVEPDSEAPGARQLQLRQQHREPCRCGPGTRPHDNDEVVGLTKIFIDRAQESVIHREEIEAKLSKGTQPDRVYGLAETRNLQNLLYSTQADGNLVPDVIQKQPYSRDGYPLLFPFLVVEAKSAKSSDDWYSMKLQTAFPMFTFLEVQQSLRNAAKNNSRGKSGPLSTSGIGEPANHAEHSEQASKHVFDDFHALDSPAGIIRHASPVESKFYALYLTADNIKTFLNSLPENTAIIFCRKVLTQLKSNSTFLRPNVLDRIERVWTGYERLQRRCNTQGLRFYATTAITAYMTPFWDQVRTLSVIAVAEDAYETLIFASDLKSGRGKAKPPVAEDPDGEKFVQTIMHAKTGSACHNLLAAIFRVNVRISQTEDAKSGTFALVPCESSATTTWRLVQHLYNNIKCGRSEPDQPFFRLSAMVEYQNIPLGEPSWIGPFTYQHLFKISPTGVVLIYGGGYHHDPGRSKQSSICVYLARQSLEVPTKEQLGIIIKNTFEDYDVFHTIRDNGKFNIRQYQDRDIWNIKRSYGLFVPYENSASFQGWLENLESLSYTRQGSPRGPLDSANFLTRNYSPWQDPRRADGDMESDFYEVLRQRAIDKLIRFECTEWYRIFKERQSPGLGYCVCCAKKLEASQSQPTLCGHCYLGTLGRVRYKPGGVEKQSSSQFLLTHSALDKPDHAIRTRLPDQIQGSDTNEHDVLVSSESFDDPVSICESWCVKQEDKSNLLGITFSLDLNSRLGVQVAALEKQGNLTRQHSITIKDERYQDYSIFTRVRNRQHSKNLKRKRPRQDNGDEDDYDHSLANKRILSSNLLKSLSQLECSKIETCYSLKLEHTFNLGE